MDSASFQVHERSSGQSFRCRSDQAVLRAMEEQGKRCVPVGCRGGGCGLCKVQVLSGDYHCGRMSCAHVPPAAAQQGLALACQLYPQADLIIECLPPQGEGRPNNKKG